MATSSRDLTPIMDGVIQNTKFKKQNAVLKVILDASAQDGFPIICLRTKTNSYITFSCGHTSFQSMDSTGGVLPCGPYLCPFRLTFKSNKSYKRVWVRFANHDIQHNHDSRGYYLVTDDTFSNNDAASILLRLSGNPNSLILPSYSSFPAAGGPMEVIDQLPAINSGPMGMFVDDSCILDSTMLTPPDSSEELLVYGSDVITSRVMLPVGNDIDVVHSDDNVELIVGSFASTSVPMEGVHHVSSSTTSIVQLDTTAMLAPAFYIGSSSSSSFNVKPSSVPSSSFLRRSNRKPASGVDKPSFVRAISDLKPDSVHFDPYLTINDKFGKPTAAQLMRILDVLSDPTNTTQVLIWSGQDFSNNDVNLQLLETLKSNHHIWALNIGEVPMTPEFLESLPAELALTNVSFIYISGNMLDGEEGLIADIKKAVRANRNSSGNSMWWNPINMQFTKMFGNFWRNPRAETIWKVVHQARLRNLDLSSVSADLLEMTAGDALRAIRAQYPEFNKIGKRPDVIDDVSILVDDSDESDVDDDDEDDIDEDDTSDDADIVDASATISSTSRLIDHGSTFRLITGYKYQRKDMRQILVHNYDKCKCVARCGRGCINVGADIVCDLACCNAISGHPDIMDYDCGNLKYSHKHPPAMSVVHEQSYGYGLRLDEDVARDTFIGIYYGMIIDADKATDILDGKNGR